jgi:hypothetical protein
LASIFSLSVELLERDTSGLLAHSSWVLLNRLNRWCGSATVVPFECWGENPTPARRTASVRIGGESVSVKEDSVTCLTESALADNSRRFSWYLLITGEAIGAKALFTTGGDPIGIDTVFTGARMIRNPVLFLCEVKDL